MTRCSKARLRFGEPSDIFPATFDAWWRPPSYDSFESAIRATQFSSTPADQSIRFAETYFSKTTVNQSVRIVFALAGQ